MNLRLFFNCPAWSNMLFYDIEMKIKTDIIIFDLDGTLVDSSKDIAWSANRTLEEMGHVSRTYEEIKSSIGWGIAHLMNELIPGSTEHELHKARNIFLRHYGSHLHVDTDYFEGVRETIDGFLEKGIKLTIATNKPIDLTEELLASMGERHKYEVVLGGDSVENKKPHPEPVHKILDALNGVPSSTVFVGDSPVDCHSANSAGATSVGAVYGFRGRAELVEAKADYLIDKFVELNDIIE